MSVVSRCLVLFVSLGVCTPLLHAQSRIWERQIAVSAGVAAQGAVMGDGGAIAVIANSDLRTMTIVRTNADAKVLWRHDFRDSYVRVAATGNEVYVVQEGNNGQTVSLYDINGAELWQKPISLSNAGSAVLSIATRTDGSLLIATSLGVEAYSKSGIKQFETTAPPVNYNGFPLLAASDTGFFVFYVDTIYRYDKNGGFVWKRVPPRDPSDPSGVIGMAYATRDTGLVIATSDNLAHELIISKLASDASLSWRKIVGPAGFYGIGVSVGTVEFCEGPKGTLEVLFAATTGTGGSDLQQHLYTLRLSATGQTEEMHSIMSSPQSAGWFLAGFAPASDSDFSAVWSDHGSEDVSVSLARLGNVPVNDRRWVYSIDGEPVFTFDAGQRWSDRAAPRKHDQPLRHQISVRNDTVKINNYLTFVGDIKIDSSDQVNLSGNGRFFVPSFILRLDALHRIDTLRNIQLYQGDFSFGLGSGTITQFVNALLPDKFFGCSIAIDSLRILGGLDAYGVAVAGHFSLPNAIPFTDSTSRIAIEQLVLTKDSIHWRGHISNLQLTKDWKIKNISGSYDYYNDSLALACSLSLPMFKDVSAKASIRNGRLAYAATSVDPTTPIPLGLAGLTVEKFSADIKGLDAPPLNALLKASLATTPDNLMLLDLTGQYVAGAGIAFQGNMKLYFVVGAWQADANVAGSFYFNSHVQLAGGLDLVNLGTGYLISGKAALDYVKRPKEQLAGSIDASLTLPKVPGEKDEPVIRWFNDIAGLPFTFAHANVLLKDTICRVALDADLGIANVSITIDPRKRWGDTNLIRVNAKFKELPHSMAQQKRRDVPLTISADSTTVTESLGKLIVEVAPGTSTSVPPTRLVDPAGKTYTATSKPNVIYSEAPDKHRAFWTVVNPAPGTWMIASDQELPTSSITFYGTGVDSGFTLHASQSGNTLTVTPSGSYWTCSTDFYLDTNGSGYDGILIGSTYGPAPLVVDLPTSLPVCSYHVYAIRENNSDADGVAVAYAPEIVTVYKQDLEPPTNVAATVSTTGHIRVQWQNAVSIVGSYAVELIDPAGHDSIYTSIDASLTSVELDATPGVNYFVLLQPYDSNGIAGCSSVATPVVLTVKPLQSTGVEQIPTVYPNPVTGARTILTFSLDDRAAEELWLIDPLGRIRVVARATIYEPGSYQIPIDMSDLPAGTYYARLSGDRTLTVPISKQ